MIGGAGGDCDGEDSQQTVSIATESATNGEIAGISGRLCAANCSLIMAVRVICGLPNGDWLAFAKSMYVIGECAGFVRSAG